MANLVQNLSGEEETFYLDSMDLFRPGLKQIGKSIVEIKTHYMCSDVINIVPNNYTPQLAGVREAMLKHLENDSCFLYKYSVVTGSLISLSAELKKRFPGFLVLMDSLSLAIDFEISPRPNDVQCDVLLAICGQPVIVLTLVDGDKDSEAVTIYNTFVARGVTSTLRRFMDESVNVVFGVMCRSYLDTVDTFQTSIQAIAKDSSLFVTLSALETSPSKHEKIVTAFWAGVAETRSVISRDGRVDTDYLRFLTKDQCIILMENINNREVEVHFQPRTGATTLMLEVARRLSKLDKTLFVCRSQEETKRLCTLYETTVIPDELCRIDLSSFKNVVDETGMVKPSTSGRLWTFSRGEEVHDEGNDSEQTVAMKIEPESKDIGLEPTYSTKLEDVIKVFKDIKLKSSAVLSKQSTWKEEEFNLGTMDLFRPPLKQIPNSICDIKTHYMSDDGISIVPFACPPDLSKVRESLLKHLEEGSFLYTCNVVTGSFIDSSGDEKKHLPSSMVLMDSLALAMDFEISPRPSDVQCDILLAICGQPVIVLTLVDEDKDSDTVTMYNTSVARGLTTTLRRFMDESVNVVCGVLCRSDLDSLDTFQMSIQTIAKDSSLFVTLSALGTSPSKYEKIVTAFWAGVAETRSVISRDGRVDTDYLRFLTKDQCIILMENINNREVDVQFQPGSGATTLMLEVAWRLSKLEATLLVCRPEDKNRLGSVFSNITTDADLSDLSTFTNIVDETGPVSGQARGRFWRFTKYVNPEIEELQNRVKIFEKDNANKEQMIYLLSSVDRQHKMHHLSTETETLKLFDVILRGLLSAYDLASSLTPEVKAAKQNTSGEGRKDQKTKDYVCHVLNQLKLGIQGRGDLFPLLGHVTRKIKIDIHELFMKTEYLDESMWDQPQLKDTKNQREISAEQNHPTRGVNKDSKDTDEQHKIETTQAPVTDLEQHSLILSGGRPEVSQPLADGKRDITDSEKIAELQTTLATLKTEADNKSKELMDLDEATEHGVEWEYNMDCLSQGIASMKIQEVIYDTIGEDEIPVTAANMKDFHASPDDVSGARRRDTRRCLVHQLSHLQYGELTQRRLWDFVRDVNTDDLSRLSSLKAQSDYLEQECPFYVVGKKRGKHSGLVACPPMTLDSERVHRKLAVSEDGLELDNTRGSLDQGTDRLEDYCGTCSRQPIPLPLSPSTLTVPRYWETHSRVQVKGPVSRYRWILDMGVTREGEVDWIPSWSVDVVACARHPGICTQVWKGSRQVGECLTDTMSPTPGTDVTLIHGAVLDMGRGRLAFIDVNRGRVLHKFDLDIRESLFPMFGAAPFEYSQCDVAMRLVSGREIAMTDEKKSLIATALYSQ